MRDDFSSSAKRHFRDSQKLLASGCSENSSHHSGIAAECAIKHALVSAGTAISCSNDTRNHIPKLLAAAQTHLSGRSAAALLAVMARNGYFDGFAIDARYWADSHYSEADALRFKVDAQDALVAVGLL